MRGANPFLVRASRVTTSRPMCSTSDVSGAGEVGHVTILRVGLSHPELA